MFVSEALKSNSFSVSANVLSSMADERHGPEVYLATMKYLLKIMIVQGSELGKHVNHYKRKIDTQKQAWKWVFHISIV